MLLGQIRGRSMMSEYGDKRTPPDTSNDGSYVAGLNVEERFAMLFPLQRPVPFRFIRFLEIHLDSVRLHSSMISSCHPGATHFDRSTNTTTPQISRYRGVPGYRICATSKLLRAWSEGMSKALNTTHPIPFSLYVVSLKPVLAVSLSFCTCMLKTSRTFLCLHGMHVGRSTTHIIGMQVSVHLVQADRCMALHKMPSR